MKYIADLHIHSKYSIATSKQLDPEHLDLWARIKGITVVGTGDFTHPKWTAELEEKLVPAEPGLWRLAAEHQLTDEIPLMGADRPVRFLLSSEISTIYKRGDKTRKVHHVILAPDFETVEKIQTRLGKIGNITSDGRPILGLDSRDLLEIALEANPEIFFIPAHIWTPWFSALGDKSGFNSIEECYGDLSEHIFAIETGLSSDPAMNWRCSFLDKYTILSNSDAHSPEKLGREGNLLDTDLSYPALREAIRTGDHFHGTVEFYPEEGKYHHDGHRKCNVSLTPAETEAHGGLCPACGKPVTVGVLNRVWQLADREDGKKRKKRHPFRSLIPLKEVLGEILNVGPSSKKVARHYHALVDQCGSEFDVQLHLPLDQIRATGGEIMAEAVERMRTGRVHVTAGYDGEFGVIKVFTEQERKALGDQRLLFADLAAPQKKVAPVKPPAARRAAAPRPVYETHRPRPDTPVTQGPLAGLNHEQLAAATHGAGPALIIAGPGTGKTRVLTRRIAHLIDKHRVEPEHILAVTFTGKAAEEMRERLQSLLNPDQARAIHVGTFHALGYAWLREEVSPALTIIDQEEKEALLASLGVERKQATDVAEKISAAKQQLMLPRHVKDEDLAPIYWDYQNLLSEHDLVDLDDLICRATRLLLDDSEIATTYRDRYRWVLVDEYQDVNYTQYCMIRTLCQSAQANLCVIGDPNQAIYGFRGADKQYIERFQADWPAARHYSLQTSYRCPQTILQASSQIIPQHQGFLTGLQSGVKLQLTQQPSDRSEAEYIARTIEQRMGGLRFFSLDSDVTDGHTHDETRSLDDFAILVRTSAQMPALEKALNDHAIPHQVVGRKPLYQQEPIRTLLDVTRLALTPDVPLLADRLTKNGVLTQEQREKLYLDPAETVGRGLHHIVDRVFPRVGEDSPLLLRDLYDTAERSEQTIGDFIQSLRLGSPADVYRRQVEHVTLMTLHAAKGLEFPCVFIAGCEQGLLPYALHPGQESDPAEERRLLYVGMTRAQHQLTLTWAQHRHLHGRRFELPRSPFLDTIEQELVEQRQPEGRRPRRPVDNQMKLFDV